jgi:hypothetical protein
MTFSLRSKALQAEADGTSYRSIRYPSAEGKQAASGFD